MTHSAKLDPFYDEAKQLIFDTNDPTISMLQRHLKIGYERALSLMAALEGVIVTGIDESGQRKMLYSDKAIEGVGSSWVDDVNGDWHNSVTTGEGEKVSFRCFSQGGVGKALNDHTLLMPGIVQLGRTRTRGIVDVFKPQFFAIADGLSAHPEAASASVKLIGWLQSLIRIEDDDTSIKNLLRKLQRGFSTVADNPKYLGVASALIGAKLVGKDVTIFNVGNAHAYLLVGGENGCRAQRLSFDNDPKRRFIAHPVCEELGVNIVTRRLLDGERILLCSDGEYPVLTLAKIAELFAENTDEALLKAYMASRRAGGVDDFSVIVIEVGNADTH